MTMANPNLLRTSPSILVAATILLIQTPSSIGWTPRVELLVSNSLRLRNGNDAGRPKRSVLLSASNANHDDGSKISDDPDRPEEDTPLFAEGEDLRGYISRLEAIMDSEFYVDETNGKSHRLREGGERVVLGDWMDWDEGLCVGDSCGDEFDQCDIPEEYKVAAPKVDVMSFLGIRRAQPLQVQRDFQ